MGSFSELNVPKHCSRLSILMHYMNSDAIHVLNCSLSAFLDGCDLSILRKGISYFSKLQIETKIDA